MTPPDSGERCCDLATKGHRAGCPGKPDSGEREVCGAIFDGLNGKQYSCNREAGHTAPHVRVDPVCWPGPEDGVTIRRSLAQRILAALGEMPWNEQYTALASELRARMPK